MNNFTIYPHGYRGFACEMFEKYGFSDNDVHILNLVDVMLGSNHKDKNDDLRALSEENETVLNYLKNN